MNRLQLALVFAIVALPSSVLAQQDFLVYPPGFSGRNLRVDGASLLPASIGAGLLPVSKSVEVGGALKSNPIDTADDEDLPREQWFVGAYWRHLWVPELMQNLWFDVAPSVSTGIFGLDPNVGLVGTWRSESAFSIVFGLGYTSYEFEGAFRPKGDPIRNTEYVTSDLAFWHGTASFLWATEFHPTFAIEYGLGLDLGIVSGDIERSEAYPTTSDKWRPCKGPIDPDIKTGDGDLFCESPNDPIPGSDPPTDPSNELGAHYNVNVGKLTDDGGYIPNVILFPAVPHIALRFAPIREMAIKLEFAYAIADLWVGISIHGAVWTAKKRKLPPELRVVERPVAEQPPPPPPPEAKQGRVKGLVVEEGTETPIPGATVTFTGRDVSPIQTTEDGSFVGYAFEPGEVLMAITADGYEPGTCSALIPEEGGDVEQRCILASQPKAGSIEGVVTGPAGPVGGARVQLIGPVSEDLITDDWGVFKVAVAPPGTYTANVDHEQYMYKTEQFEVAVRETAQPQIMLTEKPKKTLVKVTREEIKIEEQIYFATNSDVIKPESTGLMTQIADVLLRHKEILRVEIQGHTDSRGSDSYNLDLSQRRALSVRTWLTQAGVEPDRLVAKGYGEAVPIASNRTRSGRAANRRVQFIIKERQEEPR